MSGPLTGSTLLDLLEPGWRRHLAAGEPAGILDVEPEMLDAAALALGDLSRSKSPAVLTDQLAGQDGAPLVAGAPAGRGGPGGRRVV